MNWTGGRLNHHKNSINRPPLRAHRFSSNNAIFEQQNQIQVSDRLTSAQKFQVGDDDKLLKANSTLPPDHNGATSLCIDGPRNYSTDGGTETYDQLPAKHSSPIYPVDNHTAFYLSKQNLLAKPDWLNLSAARPVQINFTSATELSKVGRHKRLSMINQSISKKLRPDYGSQFTLPALKKRKRDLESTRTSASVTEPQCKITPPLSDPLEVFPSSPPFSVMAQNNQYQPASAPTLPQTGPILYDPDRSSYRLLSFSEAGPHLISLHKAKGLSSFEEVQNEFRKARNITRHNASTDQHENHGSKHQNASQEMMVSFSETSIPSDSSFIGSELPALLSANHGGSITSSSVRTIDTAATTLPRVSEASIQHPAHLGPKKRARPTSHHHRPSKRFKLDDSSSDGPSVEQGIEIKDFAMLPSNHGFSLSSSTSPEPTRDSESQYLAANTFSSHNEKHIEMPKTPSNKIFITPMKPRQFCLDVQFDDPRPIGHDSSSSHRTIRDQLSNVIGCDATTLALSPELFLDTSGSKKPRTDHSTPMSQTSNLQVIPAKRFDLAPEYTSCQLESSSPVHRTAKQFLLPKMASDRSEFSLRHHRPQNNVFSTP